MASPLPDFTLIGAAKCGTTTIASVLSSVPDIFMSPEKEPKFFSLPYRPVKLNGPGDSRAYSAKPQTFAAYESLFSRAHHNSLKGEASTDYLFYASCARDIRFHCGDIKIVVILRDPVARAFSHHTQMIRDGRETLTFEDALEIENSRQNWGYEYAWLYSENGFYAERLKTFMDAFTHIKVFIYEEFFADPVSHYNELLTFLGSSHRLSKDSSAKEVQRNVSGVPRFPGFYRVATSRYVKALLTLPMRLSTIDGMVRKAQVKLLSRPTISEATSARLREYYKADKVELEKLLKRQLPWG